MAQLERIDCTVEFVTPAFLGNASQRGQWRVPPFKALLRRWWRILKAKEYEYDWRQLREAEGLLWGNAFLGELEYADIELFRRRKNAHRKSLIALRLSHWKQGKMDIAQWRREVDLGVVRTVKSAPRPVPVALYTGYGPVDQRSRLLSREREPAIGVGETQQLTCILRSTTDFPSAQLHDDLRRTLELVSFFGALGSRSSNGWGSLQCDGVGLPEELPLRNWQECLMDDFGGMQGWPHAVGCDNKGALIWQTKSVGKWQDALRQLGLALAQIRQTAKNHAKGPGMTAVFLLGYPVQRPHAVRGLPNTARWASQMRMKVQRLADGRYRGLVYHLPHMPPRPLWQRLDASQRAWVQRHQRDIWQEIHDWLDGNLQRLS